MNASKMKRVAIALDDLVKHLGATPWPEFVPFSERDGSAFYAVSDLESSTVTLYPAHEELTPIAAEIVACSATGEWSMRLIHLRAEPWVSVDSVRATARMAEFLDRTVDGNRKAIARWAVAFAHAFPSDACTCQEAAT